MTERVAQQTMTTAAGQDRLTGLEVARGVAALLVALVHASNGGSLERYTGAWPFGGLFRFGHSGVDFFFILSGFIIYYVHHKDIGKAHATLRYAWRRVTRIYPSYWCVTAVLLVLSQLRPDGAIRYEPAYLIQSLLLLPQGREPVLGVAWTLVHEMLFYAIFATAIISRRIGAIVASAWLVGILVAIVQAPEHWLLKFALSSRNLQFFMGLAVAHLVVRRRVAAPRALVAIGTAAFLTTGLCENAGLFVFAGLTSQLLFGVSSAVVVLGLASAERQGMLRVSGAFVFLGGASYALYLVHTITIGLTLKSLEVAGIVRFLSPEVAFAATMSVAVATACLYFRYVEQPMAAVLSRFGRRHVYGAIAH